MKRWLDRTLGAVPMYKLVLFTLAATTLVALVLSLFGQLSYEPLPILASAAVAVGTAALTGWLASLVVRRPWHPESSYITGALIALIIVPTLDPLGLLGIALASTIATVSKYVLAIRGRHVLNPAALGAWIIGLAGLGFPAWWTGTPFLQPIVIIAAFLVLYRLRRFAMAGTFLLVASAIRFGIELSAGSDIATVFSSTYLSSPLFFFVGFMLSEPSRRLLAAGSSCSSPRLRGCCTRCRTTSDRSTRARCSRCWSRTSSRSCSASVVPSA